LTVAAGVPVAWGSQVVSDRSFRPDLDGTNIRSFGKRIVKLYPADRIGVV
jgi:hypothetical protein